MSLSDAAEFVARHATDNTVVAVDAPLIMKNKNGQRTCETEIGRKFWRFHASCHTSNLTLYPDPDSVRFGKLLEGQGFAHEPWIENTKHRQGRWLFEVYPHPAQVVLFSLERIIKYKKGSAVEKQSGLRRLQSHLRTLMRGVPPLTSTPCLEGLLTRNVEQLRGVARKHYEDVLDAVFCAYLAVHYWAWGKERNEMIGDPDSGYIVVPTVGR